MNILIVDDEKYVLEGIMCGLDWDSLPFENRYVANNVASAKEIISQVPIQILLCDIEMPQENGLELLAWARGRGIRLQAIFLTSYAEFEYAKKALQLDSFEYLLKPVDYSKLTEVLSLAAAKSMEDEENEKIQQYGKYWLNSERKRKELFWSLVISSRQAPDREKILEQIQREKLDYDEKQHFVVLALHMDPKIAMDWRDDGMIYYRITNTFSTCLTDKSVARMEAIWKESANLWLGVLSVSGCEEQLWTVLGKTATLMRRELSKTFREFAVYLSEKVGFLQAYEQTIRIRQMLFNNIAYGNGVFFVSNFRPQVQQNMELDTKVLEEWLLQEKEEKLFCYIDELIVRLGAIKDLSSLTIQKLILEWMQIIFLYLYKNQIEADRLFATAEYRMFYENSDKNLIHLQKYLKYLVSKALEYGRNVRQSEDVVVKMEQYIGEHLSENLTRSSFADVLYMNADYLAHAFKKARGISLIRYINNIRLERAKELLLTTDDTVYNVALKVGYPTSSYFTKQFKENYGIGPSEYRKKNMR